ncbi:MAG: hypothetical protein ACRD4O_04140 [Bryobacteraceae bacterium]
MARIENRNSHPLPAREWRVTRKSFGRLSASELGRPHARVGNPNLGIPETVIQPLYDIYFVAPGNAMPTLQLFSQPQGAQYNSGGVAAFNKTADHTYLTQAGMLSSSYSFIIRALSFTVKALQGQTHPNLHPEDAGNILSSWTELNINQKPYFDGILEWLPAGGGIVFGGLGTLTAPTSAFASTNGNPQASNIYELPGGIQILPQENFFVTIDPSKNAGGAPSTLAAAGFPTGVPAAGLGCWFRMDGMLVRVAG